jgi:glycosyltransferase involved in cell wall biosynthesis
MKTLPSGISGVIPAYNSAESLPPLVERLSAVLPTLAPAFEIILVNDGSRDGTGGRRLQPSARNIASCTAYS